MIIREASLCLRFYTADGWTRSDVVKLLDNPTYRLKGEDKVVAIWYVCPRWFDDETQDNLYGGYLYKTSTQHLDCDYYAVYHSGVSFDEEKLKQHTIIPFGSVVANIA